MLLCVILVKIFAFKSKVGLLALGYVCVFPKESQLEETF